MLKKIASVAILVYSVQADMPYMSGEIKTKEEFKYGRFTTRMKVPNQPQGLVAAFYTFWPGPNWTEGGWNEIDIEIATSMGSKASTNLIWGEQKNYHIENQKYVEGAEMFHWQIHTFEWTPEAIRWYMDGNLTREEKYVDSAPVRYMTKD